MSKHINSFDVLLFGSMLISVTIAGQRCWTARGQNPSFSVQSCTFSAPNPTPTHRRTTSRRI